MDRARPRAHDPKIALSAQILDTHSRIDIIISQRRLRCHWRPGHPGHHGVSQSAYHLATAGDAAQLGCGEGGRRLNKDAMRRLGGSTRKGTSRCQMQAPALPNLRVYPPCQMLAPWGLDLAADGSASVSEVCSGRVVGECLFLRRGLALWVLLSRVDRDRRAERCGFGDSR